MNDFTKDFAQALFNPDKIVDTQFGPIEVQVPRDRNGQFHQHTLLGSCHAQYLC